VYCARTSACDGRPARVPLPLSESFKTCFMRAFLPSLRVFGDWLKFSFFTLLTFLLIRVFFLEAYTIPTASMENTLLVGDFLLVNKALYGAEVPGTRIHLPAMREPERGDVVVFRPPHDPGRNYVKRVVGVPGDTLAMKDKVLVLNGVPMDEEYVHVSEGRGDPSHPGMRWQTDYLAAARPSVRYIPSRDNWGPLVVPEDNFFVLGDNRDNSEDSRYWGFVTREAIRGRPWVVYLSLDPHSEGDAGWLHHVRWNRVGVRIR